jgi:flagellar biogenesis protein FliO
MEWYYIPLILLIWFLAIWLGSRFGRYRNRKPGDKKGFRKWW